MQLPAFKWRKFIHYFGFAIILFAFLYLSILSSTDFSQINKTLADDTDNNDAQLAALMEMRVAIRERAILLWQMTLIEDAFDRDELFEEFYHFGSAYKKAREVFASARISKKEQDLLKKLDSETTSRAEVLRNFAELLMNENTLPEHINQLNQVLIDQRIVADILDELITTQQNQNELIKNQSAYASNAVFSQMIIRMIGIVIFGIFFATYVIRTAHTQSKALAIANDKLQHLAHHDKLTGLPNRSFLIDYLEITLSMSRRYNKTGALMFIDLDNFKPVNDTYGHDAGDLLLIKISENMASILRKSDILARLGGDEFVVVLPEMESSRDMIHIAEKLLEKLSTEYDLNNHLVKCSGSIGICCFPTQTMTVDSLIKCADDAMYKAKASGKNQYYLNKHA